MSVSDDSALNDSGLMSPGFDHTQEDPLWQRLQKKTFAAWCNSHLKKSGHEIVEITQDLRDGTKLHKLLEVISGEKLDPLERGKMRIHLVNNVSKSLSFLKTKGMKLVGMHAEDIVDGNLQMTLGMVWTIILRFAIKDISVGEMSAKDGLLLWCQRKTKGYKAVNVKNFHISFKDGLAFCALIHKHRPELIDFDSLKKSNDAYNLNYAFEVAEKYLDIPKMLDAEDMLASVKPDEKAVMTYVSSYYHAFSSSQQAETAAKRIGKVLEVNQENEKLMQEYESLASDLLQWINQIIPKLEERNLENSLATATERLDNFRSYVRTEKPVKSDDKGRLETQYNTLQTKLRLSNRPAYTPTEGRMVSDIAAAWKQLELCEKEHEEFLFSELKRLERLEILADRFALKTQKLDTWLEAKSSQLEQDDLSNKTLPETLAIKKQHEAILGEIELYGGRLQQIHEYAKELQKSNYFNSEEISTISGDIDGKFQNIKNLSDTRGVVIDQAVERRQALEEMRLEFAKKAKTLDTYIADIEEDLFDTVKVHSLEEVETLISDHNTLKSDLEQKQAELEYIKHLEDTLAQSGTDESNPYTNLSYAILLDKYTNLLEEGFSKRELADLDERGTQEKHEELRIDFANIANKFAPWVQSKSLELTQLGLSITGSLEEHKIRLQDLEGDVNGEKQSLDQLENLTYMLQSNLVFDNSHTEFKMETIRAAWETLQIQISKSINEIDNQILIRDTTGVSEEQLEEFRKSFKHFDKDRSNQLDKFEFRSCLLSLGYNLSSEGEEDPELDRLQALVDPNATGFVSLEAFIDFMTQETVDRDTAEQVMASFKILAGDKAYITKEDIRRELPDKQAEFCISRMTPYTGPDAPEGALNYTDFASALYGASDL